MNKRLQHIILSAMTAVILPLATMAQEQMALTAIPFKLKGETGVNNIKLMWDKAENAQSYVIYRDGEKIAEVGSVVFDDYALPVGKSFSYSVDAVDADGNKVAYHPVSASTFQPSGSSDLYDNFDGKYLSKSEAKQPEGFKINDKYYKYTIGRTEKDDKEPGWLIKEQVSENGIDSWSEPRLVYRHKGCNFEGNAFNFNPVTGKIVLSSHYEDEGGYNAAKIFLAEITPGGDLVVGTAERPLGHDSRDQSIFIDDDNTAYLLSATNMNQDINIYRLDEKWTKPVELTNTICRGDHRETPYIVKVDGDYYFFSSKASGWYPSQTKYCSSSDLKGEWTPLRELGNNSTFDAQFNRIRKWKDATACWSYHWGAQRKYKTPAGNFPRVTMLAFNNGTAEMAYFRYIEFNDEHGVIPVQNGRIVTLGKPVTAMVKGSNGIHPECITDGAMCESSDYFKKSSSSAFGKPYVLTIDMGTNSSLSEINFATRLVNGSECAYKYTIEGSKDNKKFDMLADGRNNQGVGFQIHDVDSDTPYRYLRMRVYDIVSVHKGTSQNWADGIYELSAYGTPIEDGNSLALTE